MQRNRPFTMRHAIHFGRHQHTMNVTHPFTMNAPAMPASAPTIANRGMGSNSGAGSHASPILEGLKLLLDIVLLFGATVFVGWFVGGIAAKLFVDLVTR